MSDLTHPLVLPYAPPSVGAEPRKVRRRWLFCLLLVPAVIVPFVNFTFDTSPLHALRIWSFPSEVLLFLLAAGFFTAFPVVGWKLCLLVSPSAPLSLEKLAGWPIALLCAALPAVMLGWLCWDSPPAVAWQNLSAFVLLGAGFGSLGLGVWQAIRWRHTPRIAIDMLLSSAWLSNAVVCLIGFHEDPNLGYWLTLVPASAVLLDVIGHTLPRQTGLFSPPTSPGSLI